MFGRVLPRLPLSRLDILDERRVEERGTFSVCEDQTEAKFRPKEVIVCNFRPKQNLDQMTLLCLRPDRSKVETRRMYDVVVIRSFNVEPVSSSSRGKERRCRCCFSRKRSGSILKCGRRSCLCLS